MNVILLLFIVTTVLSSTTGSAVINGYSLRHVGIITRHGARSTLHPFPIENEPWECEQHFETAYSVGDSLIPADRSFKFFFDVPGGLLLPGTCGLGQLTTEGEQMHLDLGQKWFDEYHTRWNIISESLNTTQLYLRSTNVERTMESLQGQLNGMYPPTDEEVLGVHTSDEDVDTLIPQSDCARWEDIEAAIDADPIIEAWYADREALRLATCAVVGDDAGDLTWVYLYDNLAAREAHGMGLPQGVTQEMYTAAVEGADFEVASQYCMGPWRVDALRSTIGAFVGEMLDHIEETLEGSPVVLRIYSAHDSSVAPLLGCIGGDWDCRWPPFASAVRVEVLEDLEGDLFVRTLYNDEELWPEFCSASPCPYSEFVAGMSQYVPADRWGECDIPYTG
eukprot:gnl/Dysnectes_brevis/2285_a2685_1154.p1 GENE.gnl/Dysnectes_brevis/2285_a2685_1154~~gnl/Dysnectes_brevis/2285_a2685_1154.p1  ORF type:complete len:393 (-),score=155.31 gnl/Dysnectes_brevis/2285_a2685_1154:57-1235(-)